MKKLIIVAGFSCQEKTQISKELAKKLGCIYVNKDSICKEFTDYVMKKTTSNAKEKQCLQGISYCGYERKKFDV